MLTTFLQKAAAKHANKYDYSLVHYIDSRTPITIICPEHGQFTQSPTNHLRSTGCKRCQRIQAKVIAQQSFEHRARLVHGNKYQYVEYASSEDPATILCPEHGLFKQHPQRHLMGGGCPQCGTLKMLQYSKKVTMNHAATFVTRAKRVHAGKYDYTAVIYQSSKAPVTIICPVHGPFQQSPGSHLAGYGCKQCANQTNRTTQDEFITAATQIHRNQYDYSKIRYVNANTKITIVCPKHGDFDQKPSAHLAGHGCRICATEAETGTTASFIERAINKHGTKYDYSDVKYVGSGARVTIKCPKHGPFQQIAGNHLSGYGCQKCKPEISKQQTAIYDFVSTYCDAQYNNRDIIAPLELDIWVPSKRLGLELHGIYHHSANTNERDSFLKYRNQQKALAAHKSGIKLVQIFSDEWETSEAIWQSIIRTHLGVSTTLYARKTNLVQLPLPDEKAFFTANHLRGYAPSTACYALAIDGDPLIAMSFVHRHNYWEIQRFATKLNHVIVGGKTKLYKHFLRKHTPQAVLTYADLRYSAYYCYCGLGLTCTGHTKPGYRYIKQNVSLSRQQCQKHKLAHLLENYDATLTEPQNMFRNGYRRLWDAGSTRFWSEY